MKNVRIASLGALCLLMAAPALAVSKHKPARVAQAAPAAPAATSDSTGLLPTPAELEHPSLTLEEALGVAYETNPDLAAAQAQLRAADEQVAIANGAWRPTISVGATYGVEKYFFPGIQIA